MMGSWKMFIYVTLLLLVPAIEPKAEDGSDGQKPVRGGVELGLSYNYRPSISWTRHSPGTFGWYAGIESNALVYPFPIEKSQSAAESNESYFFFYPEFSGFIGLRASLFDIVDSRIDLNLGGDAYFEYAELSIPAYAVEREHFAWALTPWAWLRPSLRFNPGALSRRPWLRSISLEASAVIAIGDPVFIYERLRWDIALLWRP